MRSERISNLIPDLAILGYPTPGTGGGGGSYPPPTGNPNSVLVTDGSSVAGWSTVLPSGLTIPSPTLTGAASIGYVSPSQYIEMATVSNGAYIDFHSNTSGVFVDYDTRILSSGGSGSQVAQGTLNFFAASFNFNNQVSSGTAGGFRGGFILNGNTSGAVSIRPQVVAGTYNFNLPITSGSASQALMSGGGGSNPMTWLTATDAATASTLMTRDASGGTNVSLLTLPTSVGAKIALTSTAGIGIAADSIIYYLGLNTQFHEFGFGTAGSFTSRFRMALNGAGFGIYGTTSGIVNLTAQEVAGTYNYNLPTTSGSAGDIQLSGGGGAAPMTWLTPGAGVASLLASGFATITSPTVSGALTLNGGVNGGANTAGGGVSVLGAIGSGSGAGGALTLTSGQGGATGVGGNVSIAGGRGGATSGVGGNVSIISGSSTSGSAVGSIAIQGADTPGGGVSGGSVTITSGGNSGGSSSSISLTGGPGGANGGTGSSIVINSGTASLGGSLVLSSGSAQSGASTNTPGAISIVGGSAPNGGTTTNVNSSNTTITNPKGSGTGQVGKINFLADASGTASGNVLHTSVNRLVLNGSVVGMTSAAASTIATVTTASNSMSGGSITYTAESSDGTDFQTVSGRIDFSVVNKAGVLTTNIATATAATAVSAGTFTLAFSFSSNDLRVTPTTSLTATTLRITYMLVSNSQQAITVPA